MGDAYDHPKPLELIRKCIRVCTGSDSEELILDVFAGSGTTAHAVLDVNRTDLGNRRFILVQLPEPLDADNPDQKAAVSLCDSIGKARNIAEITKERVRRAIKKLNGEN